MFLDIGNVCNQYCKFCSAMLAPQKRILLSERDFENFDWLAYVTNITFSGNHGDVFANKSFPCIFKKIFTLAPFANYGVYTNGLGLYDENLHLCMTHFKKIHISLNAITEKAYTSIIKGGSFHNLMNNIKNISKRKRSDMLFSISYVLTAETASDVNALLDFAQAHSVDKIILNPGYYGVLLPTSDTTLPQSSFLENYSNYFDLQALQEQAKEKGICLIYNFQEYSYHHKMCYRPWTMLYLGIIQSLPAMYICCGGGRPILQTSTFNNFSNILKYWNHERLQQIRQAVNNPSVTEGMCAFCKTQTLPIINTPQHIAKNMLRYNIKSFDTEYRFYDQLIVD